MYDQLKAYCVARRTPRTVLSIIIAVVVSAFMYPTVGLMMTSFGLKHIDLGVIVLAVFGVWLYHAILAKPEKRFEKKIAYCQRHGLLDSVYADFQTGISIFDNTMIVGNNCIISRDLGRITFFNEIQAIRQKLVTKGDEESEETFLYFQAMVRSRWVTLSHNGGGITGYEKLGNYLISKNPMIVVKK